jgi:hypothetical protein
VRVEPRARGPILVVLLPEARHRDQETLGSQLEANSTTGLVPVHSWHSDVEQHDLGSVSQDLAEASFPVVGGSAFTTEHLDELRQRVGGVAIVVDHHHPAIDAEWGARVRWLLREDLRGQR